jgi:hypothetical protein
VATNPDVRHGRLMATVHEETAKDLHVFAVALKNCELRRMKRLAKAPSVVQPVIFRDIFPEHQLASIQQTAVPASFAAAGAHRLGCAQPFAALLETATNSSEDVDLWSANRTALGLYANVQLCKSLKISLRMT